tara:strand:+ start:43963 stop:44544 length:582 start_codon:yes stop_codon:yes gene_type:complete
MIKKWTKITEKPFFFIRHGQTDWNVKHHVMGVTDIPLNQVGTMQAQSAHQQFKGIKIENICYSPLKRASCTAEILNDVLQCKMHPIEELKEFNIGNFAGKKIGDWFDEWIQGKNIPGAEHFHEFVERSILGINKALEHKGPVLIVAHGGVYWAIKRAIEQPHLADLPNCILSFFSPQQTTGIWKCTQLKNQKI